jgi:8-oxo-dGTP diphosphatase
VNTRIHVAVGVIYSSDLSRVLISKRTAKQHLAGLWEFPGGKVENNEDVISALERELHEELGIVVKEAKQLTTVTYDYPDKKVFLDVWKVKEWSGEPVSKENQQIVWSRIEELNNYNFLAANKHIIQTLSLSPVYVISQATYDDTSKLLSIAKQCFASGLKLFQLRLNSRSDSGFPKLVEKLSEMARSNDAKLILNGTPADINVFNVDGLHLKSGELMKYETRPIGESYILGASCHNEEELSCAEKLNVNYAFISPVYDTNSHPEKNGIGWDSFYNLKNKVNFPVYALGGMSPSELKIAKSYGAFGVAMISAIWNSSTPVSDILTK